MKKNLLLLATGILFLGLPAVPAHAQNTGELNRREKQFGFLQEFFDEFISLSNEPWRKESMHLKERYKAMFTPGMDIYDEVIPEIGATSTIGTDTLYRFKLSALEKLPTRSLDEWFSLYSRLFSKDRQDVQYLKYDYLNAAFNTDHLLDSNLADVVFVRRAEGLTNKALGKGLRLENTDTIQMRIRINPAAGENEIKGTVLSFKRYINEQTRPQPGFAFRMIPPKKWLSCPGNADCDLLPDSLDVCPSETGYDAEGCNAGRFVAGINMNLSVCYGQTSFGTIPKDVLGVKHEENAFAYRGLSYPSKATLLFKGGLEFDVFTFRFKNIGLGGGIFTFLSNSNKISANTTGSTYAYAWENSESSDPSKKYMQVVRFSSIEEEIRYTSVGIPVLLKYNNTNARSKNKKLGYFFHAGPYFSLVFGRVSGSSKADYEAYYGSNPGSYSADAYSDPAAWAINNTVVSQNATTNSSAEDYYQRKQDAGYNVGRTKTSSGSAGFTRYGGLGFILRTGGYQRLTRSSYLLVSLEVISGTLGRSGTSSGYLPTKSASNSGDYKPSSGIVDSIKGTYVGASLAYQIKFFRKKKAE